MGNYDIDVNEVKEARTKYFKEDNWQDGIKKGYNAILFEVEKEYDVTVEGSTSPVKGEDNDTSFSSIAFSFMLITIMIIIPLCNKKARRVIAVLAGISSGHGGGFYGGGSSFGGESSSGGSFRRWRFLRWRRLFKKFLKVKIN